MQLYMRLNPKGHQTLFSSGLGKGSVSRGILLRGWYNKNYDFDLSVSRFPKRVVKIRKKCKQNFLRINPLVAEIFLFGFLNDILQRRLRALQTELENLGDCVLSRDRSFDTGTFVFPPSFLARQYL